MHDTKTKFETVQLTDLESMAQAERDALDFGVIGLRPDTRADIYNATEASMAGIDPSRVLGFPFFATIGQCMNNFMVAQRFEDEADLDEIVPFVLTLRMRPTRVRLRLLQARDVERRYVLVAR
ncbi:MAG: hypothetical protein PF501_18190 [Salinisphaera sp.]|jgi:photoactive yellow protein|nr:hypothetical protein [Salinisphaera sp.]